MPQYLRDLHQKSLYKSRENGCRTCNADLDESSRITSAQVRDESDTFTMWERVCHRATLPSSQGRQFFVFPIIALSLFEVEYGRSALASKALSYHQVTRDRLLCSISDSRVLTFVRCDEYSNPARKKHCSEHSIPVH